MKITFEGREWEFDLEAITLKQGVAMHLAYGFTVDDWLQALGNADPRALQCLYWLMLAQDGQVKVIKDVDCRIVDLAMAFGDATDKAAAEAAQPDPTSPPPSPPGGPPSPAPPTPTATIPMLPAPPEGGPATASTAAS